MLYIFLQQISHSTNTLCAWKFHRAKIIMCIAVSLFVRSKSVSQSYDETSCIMWPSEQSQTQMKKKIFSDYSPNILCKICMTSISSITNPSICGFWADANKLNLPSLCKKFTRSQECSFWNFPSHLSANTCKIHIWHAKLSSQLNSFCEYIFQTNILFLLKIYIRIYI